MWLKFRRGYAAVRPSLNVPTRYFVSHLLSHSHIILEGGVDPPSKWRVPSVGRRAVSESPGPSNALSYISAKFVWRLLDKLKNGHVCFEDWLGKDARPSPLTLFAAFRLHFLHSPRSFFSAFPAFPTFPAFLHSLHSLHFLHCLHSLHFLH